MYCLWCKEKIISKNAKKYCSSEHYAKDRYYKLFIEWYIQENNKVSIYSLKKHVITMHGYECQQCKISTWNGKYLSLHLEHKDGNSENNSPSNVCLLCPNCHSLTSTYKIKNKGNGRFLKSKGICNA